MTATVLPVTPTVSKRIPSVPLIVVLRQAIISRMSSFIPLEQDPRQRPEWQSPQSIRRIVSNAKPGDLVRVLPTGDKYQYLLAFLESGEMLGCVDEASRKDRIVLWNGALSSRPAFSSQESRSYDLYDIKLISLVLAEKIIPAATEGRFRYGMEARVQHETGMYVVTIDSYISGSLSGKTSDGYRLTGLLDAFTPYNG